MNGDRQPARIFAPECFWRNGAILLVMIVAAACWFRIVLFPYYHRNNDVGAYLFAAETLAMGTLKVDIPAPDHPDIRTSDDAPQFFRTWMVVPHTFNDRRPDGTKYRYMYSKYPPGHPLMLALGKAVFGRYEVVPVFLLVLSSAGMAWLLAKTATRQAVVIGLALLAFSPFYLAIGSSLLSHGTTLFVLTCAMICYQAISNTRTPWANRGLALACGVLHGWALACRPATGAAFILALIAYEALLVRKDHHRILRVWPLLFVGGTVMLTGLLWYNNQLTGHPFRFPFAEYWPRTTPGFTGWFAGNTPLPPETDPGGYKGWERIGELPVLVTHTPWRGILLTGRMLSEFSSFAHAVPGLVWLVPLGLFLWHKRLSPLWRLFVFQACFVLLIHFTQWNTAEGLWGPRFYYAMLLPFVLLAAPMINILLEQIQSLRASQRRALLLGVGMLAVVNVIGICRWTYEEECRDRDRDGEVFRAIEKHVQPPALVFLEPQHGPHGRYVGHHYGYLLNPPAFGSKILYAVNHGDENPALIHFYPGRRVYEIYPDAFYEIRRNTVIRHEYE